MRRREKFVIASILLSLGFFAIQYVSLEWRYLAILGLSIASYLVSSWALSDDLQFHERLTVVPLPALYAGAVSLFYFLLPGNFVSRIVVLFLFGIGLYGLYLTSNIYSVAKGRTIQLLYAAHAVGLLFTLLTSLLLTNTIFSLNLPFYLNGLLVGLIHYPLSFMSLWSVRLEDFIDRDLLFYSLLISTVLAEFSALTSLAPFPVWHSSLFVSGIVYLILGVVHAFLRGRLFKSTTSEYSLVAGLLGLLFLLFFPWK
ncbi:MAG: hypothetical protein GF381_01645 [Candidatus Pacebacteria bacterium]|nr:hypothetical protein [Candidatus Paceibacterota bacterium]